MDPPMVKSVFSLALKYCEWMNSKTYLRQVNMGPYLKSFGVGLLVRLH